MSGRQVPDRDEAIATLFHAFYPKLVRTGYSLAGDWAVAEELAQEAFARLWRRWRWIRDPETAPAYLYRTVVNLSNSAIRRRALERRVAGFRTEQPAGPDPVADLDLQRAIAAQARLRGAALPGRPDRRADGADPRGVARHG
jgi:DNA-directed RNA polymerase specialized sigma24 family protein